MEEYNRKRNRANEERTLKDLTPNVAALLCYVGGWVSGLIFLVLEQKNKFVRFHAIQSIIVFGFLTVAGGILGKLPVVGPYFFSWVIGLIGFILWIILMLKALHGDLFQLPWAGDWAARIVYESGPDSTDNPEGTQDRGVNTDSIPLVPPQPPATEQAAPPPPPVIPPPVNSQTESGSPGAAAVAANEEPRRTRVYSKPSRTERFNARYYSNGAHIGRIAGSAFAIAWSVVLLIFFNFFSQYIAFYDHNTTNQWIVHTLVTADFSKWLPMVNTALAVTIVGHILVIIYDRYWSRSILHIIGDILGLATIVSLLVIFPFDFSSVPGADTAHWIDFGLTTSLIVIAIICGISAFARFITLIVHLAERRY